MMWHVRLFKQNSFRFEGSSSVGWASCYSTFSRGKVQITFEINLEQPEIMLNFVTVCQSIENTSLFRKWLLEQVSGYDETMKRRLKIDFWLVVQNKDGQYKIISQFYFITPWAEVCN
jgi:hypothetical protein